MIVSEPAFLCLHVTIRRIDSRLSSWCGMLGSMGRRRSRAPEGGGGPGGAQATFGPALGLVVIPADSTPAMPDHRVVTLTERQALALAVQGILFARRRRHGDAHVAFAGAVRLDPSLKLASLDGFWSLPRAGQEAAVQAYEAAALPREAAMLGATLRDTYRLRAVPHSSNRASQEEVPDGGVPIPMLSPTPFID